MRLTARPVEEEESRAFNKNLDRLHYAGACHPVGRFLRLVLCDSGRWVGGFILRNTIPHVSCRDRFFGLYKYRSKGRFPRSDSPYWRRLNEIVNIGRVFVLPEFQGRGMGIRTVALAEHCAVQYWEELYDSRVVGLDCLDLAPPEKARIFTENDWSYLGKTTGHSRKGRPPSMKKQEKDKRTPAPSLTVIHPPWFVYAKRLC